MVKQKLNLRKTLKLWGNNLVAVFTAEDKITYGLDEGDIVDISDLVKIKKLPKNQTMKQIKQEIKQ